MDLEELAAKVAALESTSAAAQQEQQLNGFMSTYGSQFNNNRSIGGAILGELDRRGIGQDAMADAVQEVLDQLRQESIMVRDQAEQLINDLQRKVDEVSDAVSAATGAPPDAAEIAPAADNVPVPTPPVPEASAPVPPPDTGAPPPPTDASAAPPPALPVDATGATDPNMPPPDAGATPPPPPIISDERLKNIRALKEQRAMPKPRTASPHILSGIMGGLRG